MQCKTVHSNDTVCNFAGTLSANDEKTKQSLFAATFILADVEEFCNELEYTYFIRKNIVVLREMLKKYVDEIGTYIFGYEDLTVIQDRDLLCKTTHFSIVVKLIVNAETI